MAIAAVRPRAHYERGFAHSHERRSPQAGVSSSVEYIQATPVMNGTAPTAASNPQTALVPTNLKGLVGVIVVLGLFALAVTTWKIIVSRRRRINMHSSLITVHEKQTGSAIRIDLESANMEKPSKVVLRPIVPPAEAGVGWVPQLRADVAPPKVNKKRSKRATKPWEKNLAEFIGSSSSEREAPPSYFTANTVPLPPVPASPPRKPLPLSPMSTIQPTFISGVIPPPSSQKPIPSPARTSSYALRPIPVLWSEKKLPRLMNVEHTFDASREDELFISVGETIRLLEEYGDEWCLVQRVGRIDAEKGVIPRLCLTERPELVPIHPGLPSVGSYRLKEASLPSRP